MCRMRTRPWKSIPSWPASSFFFFQAEDGIRDYKVTGVQTCALPISGPPDPARAADRGAAVPRRAGAGRDAGAVRHPAHAAGKAGHRPGDAGAAGGAGQLHHGDRKSTRLNSSHLVISYAVFCLKKKKPTGACPEKRTALTRTQGRE